MGRTDEVQFLLECTAAWRSLGGRVTFEPGWEGRGNGLSGNYEGGLWHHTAFLSSPANPFPARSTLIGGRPDLSGPLCNVAGPWCPLEAPLLHVIAAFPANHAGASGGRSMGPLPVTRLFNPRVVGLEIDYGGVVPMAPGQKRAAYIFGNGLSLVLGRSIEYLRAHAETSVTGKWDIGYADQRTYDMAAFRREAAAITAPGGLPPAAAVAEEDDMPQLVQVLSNDKKKNVGWWALDAIGYHQLHTNDAVAEVRDRRKWPQITITLDEHESWLADQKALTGS